MCWSRPFYSLPSTLLCNNVVSLPHHRVPFVYESQFQRQLAVCLAPFNRLVAYGYSVLCMCVCVCVHSRIAVEVDRNGQPDPSSIVWIAPPPRRFVLNRQPAQRKARKGTQRKARLKTESRQTGRMASLSTLTLTLPTISSAYCLTVFPLPPFRFSAVSLLFNPHHHPFPPFPLSPGFFPPFPRLFSPPSPSLSLFLSAVAAYIRTQQTQTNKPKKNRVVGHTSPTPAPTLVASCSSLPSPPGLLSSVSLRPFLLPLLFYF